MKLIHNITITSFVKAFEDEKKRAESIIQFLPENFEDEGILIEEDKAKIQEGENLTIYSVKLTKERHTKQVISALKEYLGEEQCKLIREQEDRVDTQGNLYIRLERVAFEEKNEAILTESGDCFHFKIMLACFPKTRESALKVAKKLFE